ncbi:hypothetical protein ATY81_06835 [Rhizobium sp. R72]|nr:hypothetical protein ATY81_06835 [Rhizobium sp. R72]OWW01325.1 hypothetical protein ATY80_06835 [Rhizobium sp. R711]
MLEGDFIVAGDETTGTVWRVPEQFLRLLDADPAKARAEIMRRLGRAPRQMTTIDVLIQVHRSRMPIPKSRKSIPICGRSIPVPPPAPLG